MRNNSDDDQTTEHVQVHEDVDEHEDTEDSKLSRERKKSIFGWLCSPTWATGLEEED